MQVGGDAGAGHRAQVDADVEALGAGGLAQRADRAPKLSDEEGLIVARGELVYAVLNLYPYNAGHVLICPFRHVADYTDLTQAETAEFSEFTKRAVGALRQASGAQGFNIGINLGRPAGAGLPGHLHQHIVPRWNGDTNFMHVIGETHIVPQAMNQLYEELVRMSAG